VAAAIRRTILRQGSAVALPERFRDKNRDLRNDLDRIEPIRDEFLRALSAIDHEEAGLTRRLEIARMYITELLGNEDGIYYERDPADEANLVEAEAQMMSAYRRIAELKTQRTLIGGWLDQIEASDAGSALANNAVPPTLRSRAWLRRLGGMAGVRNLCGLVAWLLAVVIIYSTLSGIEQRPSLLWHFPDLERALAFLAAAAAFAIGYPRHRVIILVVGLAMAALLEAAQVLEPTRHGTIHDWTIKAIGLGLGLLLVVLTERFRRSVRYS
jgi:VanZ family protein